MTPKLANTTRGVDLRWLDRRIARTPRRTPDIVAAGDKWEGFHELDPRYWDAWIARGMDDLEHRLLAEARMDTFTANPQARPEEE